MQSIFDRLAQVPLATKVGALVGAIVILFAGYWYFWYSDMQDQLEQLQRKSQQLKTEKADYERRKREYLAFRNEVNGLLEEQKELLRVLPKSDDIEQFIESVQAQVELAGLTKVSSIRDAAQPVEMYVKIPIRMSLVGTYHQINHFFKNVGDLKRIVNIEDLNLSPADNANPAPGAPNLLKASFVATTFMFEDKSHHAAGPSRGPSTSISTGGGR